MKKSKKILIWSSIAVVLLIIIIPKINFTSGDEVIEAPRSARAISVSGLILRVKPLQNKITSNGTLISDEEVELRSEISGKITKILFEEGRRVKKGMLLLKINDSELQATLKKNKARETLARDREYRYKQLLEKNLTSQQEYDVALSELNSVLADVEFTEAQIQKTEIRAPFDGVIGLRTVSTGSYISPQTKIATLQNINPIKIDFAIPQKYFGMIREGKTVFIKQSADQKKYTGRVYAVEPKIDQNTRTVQVRAIINNDRSELTPGAYVEVEIVLEDLKNALLIPTEALVPDLEGEKVFVYKNGKAIPQIVKTGIRTEKEIQMLSGVELGDTIIVSGIIQLRPKAPVKLNEVN